MNIAKALIINFSLVYSFFKVDGNKVDFPSLEGIVILNIGRYVESPGKLKVLSSPDFGF